MVEWLLAIPWFIFSFLIIGVVFDNYFRGSGELYLLEVTYAFFLVLIITFVGVKLSVKILKKFKLLK